MGLFCSVVHVRGTDRSKVIQALHRILEENGWASIQQIQVPPQGPNAFKDHDEWVGKGAYYIVGGREGSWSAILEAHFAVDGAPDSADVAARLSEILGCYTLSLIVHDDDLFLYNLYLNGRELDGYNSCPQYFEQKRLSDDYVESQRHTPEAFVPILPPNAAIGELNDLLDRGWWSAYNSGRLDEDGVIPEGWNAYVFEGDRLTAFGTLLELHGNQDPYPYSAWLENARITWSLFVAVRYDRK